MVAHRLALLATLCLTCSAHGAGEHAHTDHDHDHDDDGAGGGADAWKRAFGATALISAAPTLILPLIPASAAQGGAVQKVLVSFAVGGLLGDGACAVLFLFCFGFVFVRSRFCARAWGEGGFASSTDGRW